MEVLLVHVLEVGLVVNVVGGQSSNELMYGVQLALGE